jgi:hypothetical protein
LTGAIGTRITYGVIALEQDDPDRVFFVLRETAVLLKQAKYFHAKIRRAWSEGTLREKVKRFLLSSFRIPLEVTIEHYGLAKADRHLDVAAGFGDHRARVGHYRSDPEHLRRIIAAYRASKRAQEAAPAAFAIRGLWAEWIDLNFKDLVRALQTQDVPALVALLENLHREPFTRGAGSSFDEYLRYRTSVAGRFYVRTVWCRYRDRFRSLAPGAGEIHNPLVGNPAGLCLDGEVIPIHAFRYAYHAREMAEWLKDTPGAVIAEIGGGIGAQAYQVLRNGPASLAKYLLFDIPEVAAVSSYFLLSSFPDKRIRLFGEGPVSTGAGEDCDVAVLPHFAVVELAAESVDLFHNSCSFSEMDRASTRAYLEVMERACRRYFSHINHETRLRYRYSDGTTSENLIGSEVVPDPQRFRRIFQKPRVFCLPEDRPYPVFEYLYERRARLKQPEP